MSQVVSASPSAHLLLWQRFQALYYSWALAASYQLLSINVLAAMNSEAISEN